MPNCKLSLVARSKYPSFSDEKGVTLIEVALSVAILGVVAVSILMGLATSFKANYIADSQSTTLALAQSQLENIESQLYQEAPDNSEVTYASITPPSGYFIWSVDRAGNSVASVKGVPWDSEDGLPVSVDIGLQKIKLVIKQGNNVVLTLETLKVR